MTELHSVDSVNSAGSQAFAAHLILARRQTTT
jgi:hypothetical protein